MVVFKVIFPIFVIALLGYIVAYKGMFSIRDIEGISRYVFNVAIPVMLFNSMAHVELPEKLDTSFLLSYYLVVVAMFFFGVWLSKRQFNYTAPEQAVFGMGICYSNSVLIGLPLISSGLGDEALLPLFMLIAVHSALVFFLVTLTAERDSAGSISLRAIAGKTVINLFKNPIILGLVLGLLVNWLSLPIPTVIDTTIELISRSALPCALFVLGAGLSAYKLAGHFKVALTMVVLKQLLQPALVWVLAFVVFQIDPLWGAVAVMMAAMPVGINVYMFAQKYQVCLAPVSSAIVISTSLAVATQSLLLAFFINQS